MSSKLIEPREAAHRDPAGLHRGSTPATPRTMGAPLEERSSREPLLSLPLTERLMTPRGPMLVRDLLAVSHAGCEGWAGCEEVVRPTEVFWVRTVSGHEVRATSSTVFRTPLGDLRVTDLEPGHQVLLQASGGEWNPDRRVAGADGEIRWTTGLGELLGRIVASGWYDEGTGGSRETRGGRNRNGTLESEQIWIAFPHSDDPDRIFRTRQGLVELTGCSCRLLNQQASCLLVADDGAAKWMRALGIDRTDRIPESIFRAPVDVVHVFLRAILEDLAVPEEGAARIQATTDLIRDLQELLAFLGVLSVRWDDHDLDNVGELILPPRGVRAIPVEARPRAWDVDPQVPCFEASQENPVTTVLEIRSEGTSPSFARLQHAGSSSLRGFLVLAD